MRITFRFTALAAVVLAALFLAACGPAANTEDVSPLSSPTASAPLGTSAPEPSAEPTAIPSPVAGSDDTVNPVESARGALANHLGILPQNVLLVSVEEVSWPDTSLGCPEEGQMYAQVIVPGQRIVLAVDDAQYIYHAGDGRVVLCQDDGTPRPGATPEQALDPAVASLVEKAKEELSGRAGVAVDDIALQAVEAVQWRDSSLGCPQPGMQYLQVITPGYLIRLEAGGQVYEYHTDQENVVYCAKPATGGEGEMSVETKLVAAARADLASVAGVAEDQIEVLDTQYVEWRDASLGCPKAGQMYAQVITPGYLIRLRAAGQEYEYHTSMTQVMLCRK